MSTVWKILGVTIFAFNILVLLGIVFTKSFIDEKTDGVKKAAYSAENQIDGNLIETIPAPARSFFNKKIMENLKDVKLVNVQFTGGILSSEKDTSHIPVEGHAYISSGKPAMTVTRDIRAGKILPGINIDSYLNGEGNKLIKLLSSLTISDASGKQTDINMLSDYLSFSVFNPRSLLPSEKIEWREKDSSSAYLIIKDGDLSAEFVFTYDENKSKLTLYTEDTFLTSNAGYVPTPIRYEWENIDYTRDIPVKRGSAAWVKDNKIMEFENFIINKVEYYTKSE